MNYWEILGIKPGTDVKKIKVAYARLLKKTRPEDDPEGFTKLHKAYKSALATVKYQSTANKNSDTQRKTNQADLKDKTDFPGTIENSVIQLESANTNSNAPEPVVQRLVKPDLAEQLTVPNHETTETVHAPSAELNRKDATLKDDLTQLPEGSVDITDAASIEIKQQEEFQQPDYQQALDKDQSSIQTYVKELLLSPRRCNSIDQWKHIETVSSMVDLHFRAQLSDWVFGAVSRANESALLRGELHIRRPVLRYLDKYFQWENQWQQLETTYGDKQSSAVFKFTRSDANNISSPKLHYYARIMAFGVDAILGGICFYLTDSFPFMLHIGALYFLVAIPLLEASPRQGSVGKMVFKLSVVDADGLRLRWYHSFIRSYVSYICVAGLKLVVWINLFTSYKYRLLLQDLITRSYVVERQ